MHKIILLFSLMALLIQPSLARPSAQSSIQACTTAQSASDANINITLDAAINLALCQNPDLAIAQRELEAVEATILQAGIRPNPELSYQMEDTRKATRTNTWQLNQVIEIGGKRNARIVAAERGRDAAQLALMVRRAEVRGIVTTAFFNVLVAQEKIILLQASLALAQRAEAIATRQISAGKVAPVEEIKARVVVANERLLLRQADAELRTARMQLAASWGNATPQFMQASGVLTALPTLPSLEQLLNTIDMTPTMALAQGELAQQQAITTVERSKRTPDITASFGVKRAAEVGRNQWIVGVSMPLPFSDRNQGNILEALRRTDKARDVVTATDLKLRTEITTAYTQLQTAQQEVTILQQEILPGAQSAYTVASKGFELGKFSFLEVLDTLRTVSLAKTQYLRALSETHRAWAEITRIMGSN